MSTTIDDKLRLFHKAIFEKLEGEKQAELQEFTSQIDATIKEKTEEYQRKLELVKRDTEKKARIKAIEIVSKEEMSTHSAFLGLKGKLITEVEGSIAEKLKDFTSSEDYKGFFLDKAKESFNSLQKGNYKFFASKKDIEDLGTELKALEDSCEGIKLSYQPLEEDYIGGFVIEDEGSKYKYDCTLDNMLLESKETIGIMVTEALA